MNDATEERHADGTVSPKSPMTSRPARSIHGPTPSVPALETGPGAAAHEDGQDDCALGHGAAATESFPSMDQSGLDAFSLRADPDAQATVTDFLDFTEYLPADMERSLTLIAKLDQAYLDSSTNVHRLTNTWSYLPSLPQESRPNAVKLRAEISANLDQGLRARVYSHAEALRMAENVNRHYFRVQTILSKLRTSLEKYPEAEQQQQAQQQQKQQQQQQQKEHEQQQERGGALKPTKSDGQQRIRRQRVPRITVPGEVLAPYELDYEMFSGESDVSSPSSDDESPPPTVRRKPTAAAQPRIKLIKTGQVLGDQPKVQKVRVPRELRMPDQPHISTSSALAKLKPPPENAVIGSEDAPWLRLTAYELAKLRKRMKKNAQWSPSETMISRELKALGRNLDAFNQAKKKAEAEGRVFEGLLTDPSHGSGGGVGAPGGEMSADAALSAEDSQLPNRELKPKEAKKSKNRWAQLAAQEAEESTRRMMEAARAFLSPYPASVPDAAPASGEFSAKAAIPTPAPAPAPTATTTRKRKRDGPAEVADSVEGTELQKRVKTETPVPIPLRAMGSAPHYDGNSNSLATPPNPVRSRQSTTPVPAPNFGAASQDVVTNAPQSRQSTVLSSPLSSSLSSMAAAPTRAAATTTTTMVPIKPPSDTSVRQAVDKPTTPIHPPVRELRARETVGKDQAKAVEDGGDTSLPLRVSRASSRAITPNAVTAAASAGGTQPNTEVLADAKSTAATTGLRRPSSRGALAAASSADAQALSLAAERPRRASTTRTTPALEANRASTTGANKRVKRPAPGVVSRTSSGGSAAVGRRKAAPRKKRRSNAHQQRHRSAEVEGEGDDVEVDDDGNIIDPDEPRYCVCNRVSFGNMIQCDNIDEWFHLDCVGLTAVPARTTKWYCPDCRVLLNIGEKGEVSARGVKM
ncbi:hypothetical protein SEPCBS119000_001812 [Sporothrix epigloea]|uniref:PHD-type domain-containing protein n=1 Tax=Sporothrix epigloea TaxID=1892477 RepID=A0ABP0DFD4_9PEZI